jgi:allantoinase
MLVLRSKRVVTPSGVAPAAIHVDGERIARVGPYDQVPPGTVDYGNLVILPGLVDSHVHVNEPGRTEWEGFETATRAAAAGGITTIVDMPLNSIPATTTVANLETKARVLEGKCYVDVALWGGAIPGNARDLKPMLAAGARGFKCFMVESGVDEFPWVNELQLREAAQTLTDTAAPLLVHAEHPPLIRPMRSADYRGYLESRPADAENRAIELLRDVANETGARIHVVHLSSAGALPILADSTLSVETTPHYLHLEAERIPPDRLDFKCAPPIRQHENRERLWSGLRDGIIELVVSDHSPCTPSLKEGDFQRAWGGIASLQFVLPIVWTEAGSRGFSLADVARWTSTAPARLARLDRKGAIEPGRDADFAVFDPDAQFVVEEQIIQHRHKLTPYRGERLRGVVKETWLRGQRTDGRRRGEWIR